MGQSAVQELTRILRGMRARGVRSVWLSDTNIGALSAPLGRYSSTAPAVQNIPRQAPPPVQPPPSMLQFPTMATATPRQMSAAPVAPVAPKVQTVPPELGPQIAAMDEEQLTKAMMDCHYCPYGGTCNKRCCMQVPQSRRYYLWANFPVPQNVRAIPPLQVPLARCCTRWALRWAFPGKMPRKGRVLGF